jgi:hypothetical protein
VKESHCFSLGCYQAFSYLMHSLRHHTSSLTRSPELGYFGEALVCACSQTLPFLSCHLFIPTAHFPCSSTFRSTSRFRSRPREYIKDIGYWNSRKWFNMSRLDPEAREFTPPGTFVAPSTALYGQLQPLPTFQPQSIRPPSLRPTSWARRQAI